MLLPTDSQRIDTTQAYLVDRHVNVGTKTIRIRGTTYSVKHLTSANMTVLKPNYLRLLAICATIALFATGPISATLLLFSDNLSSGLVIIAFAMFVGITILCLIVAIGWIVKTGYVVRAKFSSGENVSVFSEDEEHQIRLLNALIQTMADNQ